MNQPQPTYKPDAHSLLENMKNVLHDFLYPEQDAGQVRKRKQILTSATCLFVAHGYRKTSMEEIAHNAAVAKGTVYLYYKNKAELLFHAIGFQNQQFTGELAAALDPVFSPRDQLRRIIFLGITLSHDAPLLSRITGSDREIGLVLEDINDDTLTQVNRMKIDFIAKLIDSATDGKLAEPVIEQKAIVLIDLMFAVLSSQRWVQSQMSLEDYAHLLSDMLVKGISQS